MPSRFPTTDYDYPLDANMTKKEFTTLVWRFLKRYPLACFCILLTWYLCLFKPPHTRLDEIQNIDKIVHVTMYLGTCTIIWIEYLRSHFREQTRKIILWAIIAPILMSGVIELAQEYCTEARSGEWADFAANSTGVVLAALLGHFVLRRHIHPKNKDNDSKEQEGRARD